MEDRKPTFEEIEEMAEGGSVPACAYIGNAYYYGWICEQDLEKALKYFRLHVQHRPRRGTSGS